MCVCTHIYVHMESPIEQWSLVTSEQLPMAQENAASPSQSGSHPNQLQPQSPQPSQKDPYVEECFPSVVLLPQLEPLHTDEMKVFIHNIQQEVQSLPTLVQICMGSYIPITGEPGKLVSQLHTTILE